MVGLRHPERRLRHHVRRTSNTDERRRADLGSPLGTFSCRDRWVDFKGGFEMDDDTIGSCWRDVADVLSAGVSRVLLYGPPGTGKTFAALHHGVDDGHAERLVCTEDLTSGEITGTWMPTGESRFEWREG